LKKTINEFLSCNGNGIFWILGFLFFLVLIFSTDTFSYMKNDSFKEGMLAEIHGILIEVILIVWLFKWITNKKEEKKWKPTRLIVARHICRNHQAIFNSIKFTLDPHYHTNLKGHGLPPNTTQKQADAWGRQHQVNHLSSRFNELKKMIEYNNVALDSSIQPDVITYIVEGQAVIHNLEWIYQAYADKHNRNYFGSFNIKGIEQMDIIYKKMLEKYPEILELEPISNGPLITVEEIIKLFDESNKFCSFLELRKV